MKSKGAVIALIVFLSILAVALVGGMVLLMNKDFNFSFNIGESNLKLIDTFETSANEVEELKFDLASTDVEVKEASDENIKIEYYSNKNKKLKMYQEGTTVIVEENEKDNAIIERNNPLITEKMEEFKALENNSKIVSEQNVSSNIK